MSNLSLFLKAILCILFSFTLLSNSAFSSETPETIQSSNNCEYALELSLFQEDTSPGQYDFYTVVATLDNVGPESIGDILIDFARPDGVVYNASDPFNLSHGSFTPHGSEEWGIENLEPGERATLTVTYFLLSEEAPIADIDIVSCFGDSGFGFADLSISGLRVQNPEVSTGDILDYNFELSNVGNVDVASSFSVKSWISVDPFLSSDDIQDGTIITGSFASGFRVSNVPGASTINENIEPGEYYLIVKVDGDDQVFEADETNNLVVSSIVVVEAFIPVPTSEECVSDMMPGSFLCSSTGPEGELVILTNDNGDIVENRVNSLDQVNSEIIGTESPEVLYQFRQGQFIKFVGRDIEFEMPIPEQLSNEYHLGHAIIKTGSGFLTLAYKKADSGVQTFDELFAVRTDEDLIPIESKFLTEGIGNGIPSGVISFIPIPNNRFMFTFARGLSPRTEIYRVIFDSDLNLIEDILVEDELANILSGRVIPLACGSFQQIISLNVFGSTASINATNFTIENNEIKIQSEVRESTRNSGLGTGSTSFRYSVSTSDGGFILATHNQQLNVGPEETDTNVNIERRNASNEIIWEDVIQIQDPNLIEGLIEFEGRPILILQHADGVEILDVDCLRNVEPELNSVDIALDVVVENNVASLFSFYHITYLLINEGEELATNIVVDIPRPEEVVYQGGSEFDTNSGDFSPYGDQKWRVDEIAPGEEVFLSISYFTLQESEFLNYAEISQVDQGDADSTPGNGGCCGANEDDEIFFFQNVQRNTVRNAVVLDEFANYPVELKSVSPNPTFAETIEAQIYSKDPGRQTLHCYNALGGLEYAFEVTLESGWNKVPLEISKLVAGTYILHLTEFSSRQPPVRFVVVRD